MTRDAVALEHFIREAVIFRLDTPDLGGLLSATSKSGDELKALLGSRNIKDQRKTALLEDYVDGTLSKPEYVRAVQRVDQQIADIEAQIDGIKRGSFNIDMQAGETVREAWQSRPDGWRRELISLLVEEVRVSPGITKPLYIADGVTKRFDPELVEIKWKL